MRLALALVACLAAAATATAFAAGPASPVKPNPCKGLKNCITVNGPWVAVPATGEATYLLECPKRNGYVAGIDTLASSADVRAEWEGRLPNPQRLDKAIPSVTGPYIFFTAYSAGGKQGLLQPWIGCIPTPPSNPRVTTSARIATTTKPGKPLDRWQTTVRLVGTHAAGSRTCGKGERLLGGWDAIDFKTDAAPSPSVASKIHPTLRIADGRVVVSVLSDGVPPASEFAEVQVGALCAK